MPYFLFDTNFFVFLLEAKDLDVCRFIKDVGTTLQFHLLVPSSVLVECGHMRARPEFIATQFQRFDAGQMKWDVPPLKALRVPFGGPADQADWDLIGIAFLLATGGIASLPLQSGDFVTVVTDDSGIVSLLKKPPYLHQPIRSLNPIHFFHHLWEYARSVPSIVPASLTRLRALGEKSVQKFVFRKVDDTTRTDIHEYLLHLMSFTENPFLRVSATLVEGHQLDKDTVAEVEALLKDPTRQIPSILQDFTSLIASVRALRLGLTAGDYFDCFLSYLSNKKRAPHANAEIVSLLDAATIERAMFHVDNLLREGDFLQASALLHHIIPVIPPGDLWDYQDALALLWFVENALNNTDRATRIARHLEETCMNLPPDEFHPLANFAISLEGIIQSLDPGSCPPADIFAFAMDFRAMGADVAVNLFKSLLHYPTQDSGGNPSRFTSLTEYQQRAAQQLVLIARAEPDSIELLQYHGVKVNAPAASFEDLTDRPLDARFKTSEFTDIRKFPIFTQSCFYPLSMTEFPAFDLVIAWYEPLKARVGLEFPASIAFPRTGVNNFRVVGGTFRTKGMPGDLKVSGIRTKMDFREDVTLTFERQKFNFLAVRNHAVES